VSSLSRKVLDDGLDPAVIAGEKVKNLQN